MESYEERVPIILENEGQKIFGIFHRPLVPHKVPAVIVCHGLAGHKTGRYRIYVTLAAQLSKVGISVLRIDYRGSGDSEGDFYDTTIEGQISDIEKGLNYLKSQPSVDTERIGLFGRSFGGTLGVISAHRFDHIKSLVLWAPMFNADGWIDKWKIVESGVLPQSKQDELMRINGQQGSPSFFEEFFKLRLDEDIQALDDLPLLHIQGEKDELVDISQSDFFVKYRVKASGLTKFIRLPNGDHDFSGAEEQKIAIEATVDWFKNTL